jgi:hypothetical protein
MAAAAAHIDAQAAEIERMKTALEQIAKNGESEWIDMNVKTARKAIGVSND